MAASQRRVLSGIQPSGALTLGNYLGALQAWKKLQARPEFEALFCVVDLHALTCQPEPNQLRERTLDTMALFLAIGLDPQQSTLFLQSRVPEHTELMWLLMPYLAYGDLMRMTQFKDKSAKSQLVNAGLLNYPCLMAADILAYQTQSVPVGEDQLQHLEMTRSVAQRMNQRFQKPLFCLPEPMLQEGCARVMSLTHPRQKMSKSDADPNSWIGILDAPERIAEKFKSAQTDSEAEIRYDRENKPGISNLLEIYAALEGTTVAMVMPQCAHWSYAQLKKALTERTIDVLKPFQASYREWRPEVEKLHTTFELGAQKAQKLARITLHSVRETLGLL